MGGLSLQTQAVDLKKRPDIVICTPGRMNRSQLILGRMIDHVMNTMSVDLDDIEVIVLDEADRLLELGFTDEVMNQIKDYYFIDSSTYFIMSKETTESFILCYND